MIIPASKKLWKLTKEPTGIYYEIKLDGVVIDRIKVEEPALTVLQDEGLINE